MKQQQLSPLQVQQACKDANIALTLSILSIYASAIPLLGVVTALVAERIAHKTPDVPEIETVRIKKNVTHYLTPFTFTLSIAVGVFYYYAFKNKV